MIDQQAEREIRETFHAVRPNPDQVGKLFYEHLFIIAPELRPMFSEVSIPHQGGKLMQVLEFVVDGLGRWEELSSEIERLGARHAEFGVEADHYAAVGVALVQTLHASLGGQFTEEAEEAWRDLYTELSLAMERGARTVERRGKKDTK